MANTRLRRLSEKEKKELLWDLEDRFDKELLKSFADIVDRAIEAKRIKSTDVVILERSPWIDVAENADVLVLVPLFSDRDFNSAIGKLSSRSSKKREDKWMQDSALWRVLIFFGVLCRGANPEAFDFFREQFQWNLGFSQGVSHAIDPQSMGLFESAEQVVDWMQSQQFVSEKTTQFYKQIFLEHARKSKAEKSVRKKFLVWAEERIAAGNQPTNLEELQALPGWVPAWSRHSEKTLRSWAREAGFVFKAGRPRRAH